MTKAALIEQLAEIVRAGHFEGEPSLAWRDIPESTREEYREDAREMWPLIVTFVATWIEENAATWLEDRVATWIEEDASQAIADEAASLWCQEMSS